ncbi:MAG: tetratricopeptide repeat protein [Deltaproteobacteria bacterium]|nr:tetratricopeptide repeat protein [Deltaproteobacteria bacterium]
MKPSLNILRGELERLFSTDALTTFCNTWLTIDVEQLNIANENKAVFARQLVDWCDENNMVEALADAIQFEKKGMTDARLKHVYAGIQSGMSVNRNELEGYIISDKIESDDVYSLYNCSMEGEEDATLILLVIHAHHIASPEVSQRFLMQFKLLESLNVPFLAETREMGTFSDGRPYVIMKPLNGNRMNTIAPLAPTAAMDVLEGILNILTTLDEHALLHGDIRPDQFWVEDTDAILEVKTIATGFDKFTISSGWVHGINQSAYMAPELFEGAQASTATDFYALGCTLFFLLTGKHAFSGRKAIEIAGAHISNSRQPVEDATDELLPDKVVALVNALTSVNVTERPKDVAALKRLIGEAREDIETFANQLVQTGTMEDIADEYNSFMANPADPQALSDLLDAADAYNAYSIAVQALRDAAVNADSDLSLSLLKTAADNAFKKARTYDVASAIYEELAQSHPDDAEIFDARVAVQKKLGNFDLAMELLGSRVEAAQDAEERIELLLTMARTLAKEAGDPAKAFDYYLACLSGSERDKEILPILEKTGQKEGRMQELIEATGNAANAAEAAGNAEASVFHYQKLAAWYQNILNQPSVALSCYQKVIAYDPSNEDALDAICSLYRSAGQWMELSQVLAQRAESESIPEAKRKYMCELAAVYFEKLGQAPGAQEILSNVLHEDPGNTRASSLLIKIYESTGDFGNLAATLEESVKSMGEGAAQSDQRNKLGEIYETHLHDVKTAAAHYKAAAEFDHLDALKGLERVCKSLGDYSGLRMALEKQLALAETANQKIQLQLELAGIYETEFKEIELAIETLESVIRLESESIAALDGLCRLHRKVENFARLEQILNMRATLCTNEDEKRQLLKERVDIIKEKLNDSELATKAVNELAELGGGGTVLSQIVRSQIELGEFEAAEKTYYKMLEDAEDIESKVDIMVILASFQLNKLNNVLKAESTLSKAKELAPDNVDVITEFAEIQVAKGDYAGALETYARKIDLVSGSESRAAIFCRMGIIALENIQDEDVAMQYLEQAISVDKSNLVASDKLAGLYRKQSKWEQAISIYERWIPSAAALTREGQLELFSFAGEAYLNVDRKERALELFKKAAELANEPALMKKLGDAALDMEEWELAREQFDRYAAELGTDIDNDTRLELLVKRGRAAFGCEQFDDAAKMARQATVMAADNLEARILLSDVLEQRKDYRGAVEARQKVLESINAKDDRWLGIIRSTALLLFEKLRNPDGASALLKSALEQDPKNRDILGELLKMHYAAKKFRDVVSVILQIASLICDDAQLSRYYLTVAKVYRRELRELDKAIEYFNKALQHDPGLDDAKNALVQVLTEQKDWEGLEKVYKAQIAALPGNAPTEDKIAVFKPLADLYMTKLDRESDAITLFETMSKIDAANLEWAEKLVELYSWNTKVKDKAIATHHKLLRANPTRTDSYRMLYRISSAAQEPDMAWCSAAMLSLLNQASPEERSYYKDYLSEGYPPIADTLSDDKWVKLLVHKDMNMDISNIYSVILPTIAQAKCTPLTNTGLNPAAAVDVTTDPSEFSKLLNFGIGVTSVPVMPLFYQPDQQGFGVVETNPPVLIAGADAAEMRDYLGLAFRLGQQLTLLRPGLFAKQILKSGTELSAWLLAAIKVFVPQLPVPNNQIAAVNEKLAPIRNNLNLQESEKLQGYVQSFMSQAADVNVKKWARSVDYTGDRAGLILCGDIAIAMRIIESQIEDEKERAERIKELSLFMVSNEHFELRKKLGIALQAG